MAIKESTIPIRFNFEKRSLKSIAEPMLALKTTPMLLIGKTTEL